MACWASCARADYDSSRRCRGDVVLAEQDGAGSVAGAAPRAWDLPCPAGRRRHFLPARRDRAGVRGGASRRSGWRPASSPPAATAALSPAPPPQARARTAWAATCRVQRMNPGKSGPSAQAPIWEEPVRGFYTDPGQFVALSGLDLLRSVLEGGLGPPVRYLSGLGLTSVEPGRLRRHPRHPGGRAVGMCGPDRPASGYPVHHGRALAQVPAHRRAAERDADGPRPADPRRQDHWRVPGRGHRPGGPPWSR